MRAWQCEGLGKFQLNEVEELTPGPGEVLIEMKAAGLCHSDVMYINYGADHMPFHPMTQGHENAGVICALGEGVEGWEIGDAVGVCSSGVRPPLGMFTHGGFADKLVANVEDLARVPEGLDFALAALATDAGMTSYHAIIKEGKAGPGMKVGVIGFGGLGQIGAKAAIVAGAEVHVAEFKEDVWPLAREAGATSVVKSAEEWAGQNFDLVVDYAGFNTMQAAINAVHRGGTVVSVGLGEPTFTCTGNTILGKKIIGSLCGTVQDIEDVFNLLLKKEITPVYTEISFDEIGEGLEKLKNNQVTGRLVARIGN